MRVEALDKLWFISKSMPEIKSDSDIKLILNYGRCIYEALGYNAQHIASSLKKIMSKKPFSKITVTEIIKDCGVNRKTFYYHFADIYALLKWMFEEEAVAVVKNFDIYTNPEEAIEFVIEYVEKNEHIISCAYDSIGRVEMKNFFSSDFRGIINGVITKAEKALRWSLMLITRNSSQTFTPKHFREC